MEPLEPRVLLGASPVIGFFEGWESTAVKTYTPTQRTLAIRGDEGTWRLGDTVSTSPEDGPTPHRAHVLWQDGSKALRLDSADSDSQSGSADNIWVAHQKVNVPITPETLITFETTGHLDDPAKSGWGYNCLIPPCYDNVSVQVVDNSGNMVAYVMQRWPGADWTPDDCAYSDYYNEIYLDPDAGTYQRNLWGDFSQIPNFQASSAKVASVEFTVDEHGWGIIDNLGIGTPIHVDLIGEIVKPRMPSSVVDGDGTLISLPVKVTNQGTTAVPANTPIDVKFFARPADAVDDTQDVRVATVRGSISGLKPGKSKTLKGSFSLLPGLDSKKHVLVAKVDAGDEIAESREDNNEVVTAGTIEPGPPFVALDLAFGQVTLPMAIIAGQPAKGKALVTVTNTGNVPMGNGQTVTVNVVAVHKVSGARLTLGSKLLSTSNLKPGGGKKAQVTVAAKMNMAMGEYDLTAEVEPLGVGGPPAPAAEVYSDSLVCKDAFVDLVPIVPPPHVLPPVILGQGPLINLSVSVKNAGNVALDKGQSIYLMCMAAPVGTDNYTLVETWALSVSGLKSGALKKSARKVSLSGSLAEGEYDLMVLIDSADDVAESDENNNTVYVGTVIVTDPIKGTQWGIPTRIRASIKGLGSVSEPNGQALIFGPASSPHVAPGRYLMANLQIDQFTSSYAIGAKGAFTLNLKENQWENYLEDYIYWTLSEEGMSAYNLDVEITNMTATGKIKAGKSIKLIIDIDLLFSGIVDDEVFVNAGGSYRESGAGRPI